MNEGRRRRSIRWRWTAWFYMVALGVLVSGGACSHERSASSPPGSNTSRAAAADGRAGGSHVPQRPKQARIETYSARSGRPVSSRTELSGQDAVRRVTDALQDSVSFAPTLVVWMLDISPSAMQWGGEIRGGIRRFYSDVVPNVSRAFPDRLKSAVWTFGEVGEAMQTPTADPRQVVSALDALPNEGSGRERTFQTVRQVLDQYLDVRLVEGRELMLVIVTDEAGDDWLMVDQLVEQPRRYGTAIYAIGVPAPFGRLAALDPSVEAVGGVEHGESPADWRPILQGPESRALERLALKLPGYGEDLELIDSGFGPFGLEWLCRSSGGAFLAVRRQAGRDFRVGSEIGWPSPGQVAFDPDIMRRYQPASHDADAYQALLQSNRARLALHQAAQLAPTEVLRDPQLTFVKRSEADLKNSLDMAQRAAAKVAPGVDQLYAQLREGAVDRDRVTALRWQAALDLALGRVCAAKARIDGYNAMLAALKRGQSFENPSSTTWVLERAETCDVSSSLEKLIERADQLLRGVVRDHAGTPWARIAQHELNEPMGWRWSER